MERVVEGMVPYIVLDIKSRRESFSQEQSSFMKLRRSNFDARCLARSSVNLLVGRHV